MQKSLKCVSKKKQTPYVACLKMQAKHRGIN